MPNRMGSGDLRHSKCTHRNEYPLSEYRPTNLFLGCSRRRERNFSGDRQLRRPEGAGGVTTASCSKCVEPLDFGANRTATAGSCGMNNIHFARTLIHASRLMRLASHPSLAASCQLAARPQFPHFVALRPIPSRRLTATSRPVPHESALSRHLRDWPEGSACHQRKTRAPLRTPLVRRPAPPDERRPPGRG